MKQCNTDFKERHTHTKPWSCAPPPQPSDSVQKRPTHADIKQSSLMMMRLQDQSNVCSLKASRRGGLEVPRVVCDPRTNKDGGQGGWERQNVTRLPRLTNVNRSRINRRNIVNIIFASLGKEPFDHHRHEKNQRTAIFFVFKFFVFDQWPGRVERAKEIQKRKERTKREGRGWVREASDCSEPNLRGL